MNKVIKITKEYSDEHSEHPDGIGPARNMGAPEFSMAVASWLIGD
jgi:hypothetical protein